MDTGSPTLESLVMNPNFWKGKRVFITGHTGFKGSWLCLWLQEMGAMVTGYSLAPPTTPNLFECANISKKVTSLHRDILDLDILSEAIREYAPEIIIHMAAQSLVRFSYAQPVETYRTNVLGTVNLLEAVRKNKGIKVVLNVTTDKCYENREWVWGYRENEPMGGHDPYSSSKACSELVTTAYRNSFFSPKTFSEHGVALASARAGNVIGGGDWSTDRLIPDCARKWLRKETVSIRYPEAIRPWQHVLEPLNGYLSLCEKLYTENIQFAEAWNFGPPDQDAQSVREVVEKLASFWKHPVQWTIDQDKTLHEATFLKLDCSKARLRLHWRPQWNLETALEKIARWYAIYQDSPDQIQQETRSQIREYLSLCSSH